MGFFSAIFGIDRRDREMRQQRRNNRRRYNAVVAANTNGKSTWSGSGSDEDAQNKEYLAGLTSVIQRSQDLDVNNPDVGGFNRTRVAQILGSGVKFKHTPRGGEIGMNAKAASDIGAAVNRAREIHSRTGGFDASGKGRSEGKQQERALLTMFITGCCLIHRVGRAGDRSQIPFSIELIPGTRISTPYDKLGDPLVSYGIRYSDSRRTRVTGYYVRHVSETIGNGFVPDFKWDLVPAEDCSLLEITEMAGIDRALPLSVRVMRMLRNRGEFMESAVESARAQANHYAVFEAPPGTNPWDMAADDADVPNTGKDNLAGVTSLGDGVKAIYAQNGEKVQWSASKLPDPDFSGFMDKTDERCARGLISSLSRFTRKVNSSWAGGRLEDQQDDPVIDQYRTSFVDAWHRVNEWFLESLWLADVVDLPGYGPRTRAYWMEFRATFYGKVHINPVDTFKAREIALRLRSSTPQQGAEEDGKDFEGNVRQWGMAVKIIRDVEKENGLKEGQLDILFLGKSMTSDAGDVLAVESGEIAESPNEPDEDQNKGKPTNRIFMNSIGGGE